jgi:hypothetical protein
MIQRVQTLYLIFIVGLLSLLFYLPSALVSAADGIIHEVYTHGIKSLDVGETGSTHSYNVLIIHVLLLCLSVFAIFLFKNRILQMRICMFIMLFSIGGIILQYFIITQVAKFLEGEMSLKAGFVLMPLSAVLAFMAYSRIRKDELLVRSVDRLR